MEIYIVQAGDTIYSVALKYGVSPQRLITDNGITNPERLVAGQALLILFPETVHVTARGETLASIAAAYGTTSSELLRNNPYLVLEPYLREGQSLVITYIGAKYGGTIKTNGFVYANVRRYVLEQALPYITYLIQFGYGFRLDGTIISVNDADILALADRYGSRVLLSLSLIDDDGTFNTAKLVPLLTDAVFQDTVINGMIAEITARGADGMDIDMEYIPAQYREEFAAFALNSRSKLNAAGYVLNVDLAPKNSASQSGTLYEAHDYALLGAAADYVFLMTYEWGYKYGPPMAVAPIDKVKAVLDYAVTEIPLEKIFLGMPNYAYDWRLPFVMGESVATVIGNLYAVNTAAVTNSAISFDETAQTPYFGYTDADDGSEHIVWFEDVRSMMAKYRLILESGIAGGGYWNLMRPFPQAFLLLNYIFDIEKLF